MFRIVVNTDQLKNKSDELKSAAEEIHGIQDEINSIISSVDASAYDGQLASAVSGILGGADKDAARLTRELTDLKDELIRRAGLFERANEATGLNLTKLSDLIREETAAYQSGSLTARIKLFYNKFATVLTGIVGGTIHIAMLPKDIDSNSSDSHVNIIESSGSGRSIKNLDLYISQNNQVWKCLEMGDNSYTIGYAGCLITAVSIVGRYYGADVTPKDVNNYLREKGGYSPGTSSMNWGIAEKFISDRTDIVGNFNSLNILPGAAKENLDLINHELVTGNPVVLHVPSERDDGHWVVAVEPNRSSSDNIKAIDPLTGKEGVFSISDIKKAKSFQTK